MLRINLLPNYVAQRRLTRQLAVLFIALFFACVAVPFYLYYAASRQRTDMEAKADAAEAAQKLTQASQADAAARRAQIAPIKAKVDYVKQVYDYNIAQTKFFDTVARYSDPKIVYTDAAVSGTTLTIKAFAPSLADIGRYLQIVYNEPDFQTVTIDKVPGYPEATVTRYYLYGKLVGVDTNPASAAPGAAGASPTPQRVPVPNQYAGGRAAAATTGTTTYGQPLISASQVAAKDVPQTIQDVLKGQVSPFATPQQQATQYQEALSRLTTKTSPKGFDVTVTATLKTPLVPPTLPGATDAAAGAAPGFPGGIPPSGPPPGFRGGPPPGGPPNYPAPPPRR